ncbi:hypothetical protein [Vulgatibacter sp.]|uniref:hypothetical protein n=1 Tax=Vulgatibacter sp. TaxID=1971226 RepID=UPI003569AE3B
MIMPFLAPLLLAAAAAVPAPVARALEAALAVPRARVVVERYAPGSPGGCTATRAEAGAAIRGSGRVAVRLFGAGCSGWAWANVRVFAAAWVVDEPLSAGERLAGKVRREEREVRAGNEPLASFPANAVAARSLPTGRVLEARHVRSRGSLPGTSVRVVLRTGAIEVESPARIVPCPGTAPCALLPGGKRVTGRIDGDRLVVEDR